MFDVSSEKDPFLNTLEKCLMCLCGIVNGRNQSYRCKRGDDITSHKQNRTTA